MCTHMTDCSLIDIPRDLQVAYAISAGVFGLATLVVVGLYLTSRRTPKLNMTLGLTALLFMLQVFLYVGLLLGQGSSFIPDVGSCQPWARWPVYTISCGAILAFEIAGLAYLSWDNTVFYMGSIALTLITGYFAAIGTEINDRWVWFGVGFGPYVVSFIILYQNGARWPLLLFKAVTWDFYPIIFLLGPLFLGVISLTLESYLYLASDMITKIGFAFWLIYMEYHYCDYTHLEE